MERLPDGWSTKPIKYVASIVQGSTPDSSNGEYWSDGESSIIWVTPADMQTIGDIADSARHISRKGYSSCGTQLVSPGSTVISTRAPIGKVNYATSRLCTNQGCKSLVGESMDSRFLYWTAVNARKQMELCGRGTTFTELSAYSLGHILIPVPPRREQTCIASSLDECCSGIDTAASTLETQISTLERYRASVIHEAVTRGLDPTVPAKPSGVEWISDIPESRKLLRLKDVLHINNGKEVANDDGDIPVYGSGGQFKWTDRALCSTPALLLGRKGTVNKPLLVKEPFWTVDTMFYGTQKMESDLRFLFYCALCFDFDCYQTGSTLPSMTQTDLGGILLPFPSIDEQCSIADYLDRRTSAIDAVLDTKRKQLDVLKRRRQSLIYEYVTGKRRVTEEA